MSLLQLLAGIGGLAWKSVLLDLGIESGGHSRSRYVALLQSRGSMASACPHA